MSFSKFSCSKSGLLKLRRILNSKSSLFKVLCFEVESFVVRSFEVKSFEVQLLEVQSVNDIRECACSALLSCWLFLYVWGMDVFTAAVLHTWLLMCESMNVLSIAVLYDYLFKSVEVLSTAVPYDCNSILYVLSIYIIYDCTYLRILMYSVLLYCMTILVWMWSTLLNCMTACTRHLLMYSVLLNITVLVRIRLRTFSVLLYYMTVPVSECPLDIS